MTLPSTHDDVMWTWELHDPGPHPDVSVIICAYGKSHITLQCIAALIEAQAVNQTRAEIILVDDASPDDTLARVRPIRGLKVVALEQNHGFLRAANAGLDHARGRHVLFLNNDTEPVGRWLDPLMETLEGKPRALVVGSRLVYPDGVLQEAGGIIFNDASGWNYGRRMDAFDPRVTYARQVDYVSGAALLVDGDFIRGRGGFDERYVPAYYEDTDTCFAAREAGGEVWYQPASIVVHHEGQSHGTDENVGIKAYQVVNKEKFLERWRSALELQHRPDAAVVPIARQRSTRGRIVVIDNEVPTPDKDSGSVRLIAVMAAMLDLGYAVSFLPLNGWRREPYTQRLERLGVEVLGPPSQWWGHLEEMREGISHVWISRPHVAAEVLDQTRATLPSAAIVYDTVDLHFLRFEREAQNASDPAIRREALRHQIAELEIIDKADVAVVVSPYEVEVLSGRTSSDVAIVPNVHVDHDDPVSPTGRSGVLFVGGFQHSPNEDAVEWFATQILPLVHRRHPDVEFTVVGSNVTPRVEALAGDRVRIAGWVPELSAHYAQARIALAPLRFGAGVKGKVGEAMSLGVPMVVTSIAGEGMHVEDGVHALVADDAEEFADRVCRLLEDDDLWGRLSDAGRRLIHDRFGTDATRLMVSDALDRAVTARSVTWA